MTHFSADNTQVLKDTFKLFAGNSDSIDASSFSTTAKKLGYNFTDSQINEYIAHASTNGRISYEQFAKAVTSNAQKDNPEEGMEAAFKIFDRSGSGHISAADIKAILVERMGETLSDKEIDDMIAAADVDGDAQINYEEFVKILSPPQVNKEQLKNKKLSKK